MAKDAKKKPMNMSELAKLLCHYEKGQSEVNIANMREILKNICALMVDEPELIATMITHGKKCKHE